MERINSLKTTLKINPYQYIAVNIVKSFYTSKAYVKYNNYQNLSTHHFLTLAEYESSKEFEIIDCGFDLPIKGSYKTV